MSPLCLYHRILCRLAACFSDTLKSLLCAVTGANSGIGKEAALAVAQRGGNVHMVCRDRQRGESALSAVKSVAADPSRIELHICDLASLSDIRSFAEHWTGEGPKPVHCLVNNAGLMVHTRSDTIDGVEYNFGVNVLGTYCLTELLLPSLKAADSARVITVSSGGALLSGKEALREGTCTGDDLVKEIPSSSSPPTGTPSSRKIDGELAYSRNKRCQIALTEHWSKLHKSSGIFWAAMHPGWSSTEGFKGAMPEFHNFFSSSLRTAAEGADTICWLAIADEVRNYKSGLFFLDRTVVPKHFWIGYVLVHIPTFLALHSKDQYSAPFVICWD